MKNVIVCQQAYDFLDTKRGNCADEIFFRGTNLIFFRKNSESSFIIIEDNNYNKVSQTISILLNHF